ncbi:copper resistance CopC/CopD family protein [Streptomyces sp. NPDC056045]
MTATVPHFGSAPSIPALRRPLAAAALLAALVGTVLGLLLGGAGPASAHAALTGSDPKDGAVVATAPQEISLTFSGSVALSDDSVRVLDPSGERADTGAAPRNLQCGSTMNYSVPLRTGLPDGTYTVAWQAISADSHPISGAFTFSIGAPSGTTVALPADAAGGGLVGALYGIARYAAYAGFILLAGGAAFIMACWQRGAGTRPLQRLVIRGWMTLTVATLAMLLLRYPYTGSGDLADAFDLDGLKAVLDTRPGAALVFRLLLLGASALFIAVLFGAFAKHEDGREKKNLTVGLAIAGTVIAVGTAGTWALAEYASAGIQPGVAIPVDMLHLLAVAAWLGGLTALLVALYRTPDIEVSALRRFSRVAFGSVLVLTATGIYQSWRQTGTWSALTGTTYGQLLLVKVGLVAVLVGIAWTSRRWTARLVTSGADAEREEAGAEAEVEFEEAALVPPPPATEDPVRAAQLARQRAAMATVEKKRIRDADPDRSGLRRFVLAEVGVAVALLAVTTALTSTEPARAEKEAVRSSTAQTALPAARPVNLTPSFDTGGRDGRGTVRTEIDSARTGTNELHIWIDSTNGEAMDVPEVRLAFALESKDIGPLPVIPAQVTKGH